MHRYCPKSSTNCCEILYTKWIFPDPGHTRDARLQSYQWSPQWSPSIATYSVPAPWAPQVCLFTVFPHSGIPNVSLFTVSADPGHTQGMSDFKVISDPPSDPQVSVFTVFPHPGLPKYRYLQCTRTLSSPRSASYSVPAPWAPQVSLSLHIQELMHVHILLCTQRRIHRAMEMLK